MLYMVCDTNNGQWLVDNAIFVDDIDSKDNESRLFKTGKA